MRNPPDWLYGASMGITAGNMVGQALIENWVAMCGWACALILVLIAFAGRGR